MLESFPMIRSLGCIVACSLATFLAGCSAVSFEGKVIEGSVGFVGAVDMADERFAGSGIAQAHIVVTASGARSTSETVAQGYTDSDGAFSFWVSDETALRNGVEVTTKADGYFVTRGILVIPSGKKRALVILLPRSSDAEDSGADPGGGSK